MSNVQSKAVVNKSAQTPKSAESTSAPQVETTTPVETNQGTVVQQEQPTASVFYVDEKEERPAHNQLLSAAATMGIIVTDLETLT